jgi:hypothetical protein
MPGIGAVAVSSKSAGIWLRTNTASSAENTVRPVRLCRSRTMSRHGDRERVTS